MEDYHYENRSEALRDLARLGLEKSRIGHGAEGQCVATLSYVFNHHTRELAKRLTDAHHDHHDLQVATMHVHISTTTIASKWPFCAAPPPRSGTLPKR
jgi:CopG family nickel-responsive transcriptional regulator